jgi:hypothetical protein
MRLYQNENNTKRRYSEVLFCAQSQIGFNLLRSIIIRVQLIKIAFLVMAPHYASDIADTVMSQAIELIVVQYLCHVPL